MPQKRVSIGSKFASVGLGGIPLPIQSSYCMIAPLRYTVKTRKRVAQHNMIVDKLKLLIAFWSLSLVFIGKYSVAERRVKMNGGMQSSIDEKPVFGVSLLIK